MNKSKPLVFFGTENFSAASLEQLLASGWPVELVVTKPDSRSGRGKNINEPLAKAVAKQHGIRVLQPQKLLDIKKDLARVGGDIAVLVAYGKIIPQAIIDLFPGGIINLHPSLLPRYRGPSPIEATILNGDKAAGLSLMKLTAEMDAGPIYAQQEVPLTGAETRPQLYDSLAKRGAELLTDNLGKIIDGNLSPKAQNDAEATYTSLINKQSGQINWSKPAEQIEREIRAYLGWPGSRTQIWGHDIIITKAHAVPDPAGQPGQIELKEDVLKIYAGSGYLCIDKLKPAGKKEMTAVEFIRGYH